MAFLRAWVKGERVVLTFWCLNNNRCVPCEVLTWTLGVWGSHVTPL